MRWLAHSFKTRASLIIALVASFLLGVLLLGCVGGKSIKLNQRGTPTQEAIVPNSTASPIPRQTPTFTPTSKLPYISQHVVLITDGQEQIGGPGYFCGWSSERGGFCAEVFEVQVPPEPLVLKPGQEVVFFSTFDLNPRSFALRVYESEETRLKQEGRSSFNPRSHQPLYAQALEVVDQEAKTRPQLESGQYVFVLSGSWVKGNSGFEAEYGFNIVVKD